MHDSTKRAVVFVVDNEPTIAMTAALILRKQGFDVKAFTDPLEALQAARLEAPNLLLSDVIMPDLNGFQLSSAVVADCPQCKVLLFSGNPGVREDYAPSPSEMVMDLLMKPVQAADLLKAINHKLDS